MSSRTVKERSELDQLILSFKRSFVVIGVYSFIINLLMLTPAVFMMLVSDKVLMSRSIETLVMLVLMVVWLFTVLGVLEFIRSRLMIRLGNRIDTELNPRLYQTMIDFAIKKPGQGSTIAINDLTTMRNFITNAGLFAFFDAPWIPIYVSVLFLFHYWLGFFAIFAIVTSLILTWLNDRASKPLFLSASLDGMRSNQLVTGQLRNVEVIHAMGMRDDLKYAWLSRHLAFLAKQSNASDAGSIWSNISKVLRMFFQSAIFALGAYLALSNEMSMGMMMAGSIVLGRALAPLDMIIGSWKQFEGAKMAYERIDKLLADFPANQRFLSLPPPTGAISVERLVVLPPGASQPSITHLSFSLAAGEVLGVIGPSAAGKSSLARVLMGVWPLMNGKVRLDGADLALINRDELGQYVGYLPQDIELFEGTVAHNIARFSEIDSEQVIQAAQRAGVHEMILGMPLGYDTPIGLGGIALSGGQRQRVALARAIYGNPKLVVLDEPNANLDEAGEQALIRAIELMKAAGTTVILITHRMNILSVTDKLLLMFEGQARAFGARDEVLRVMRGEPATPPAALAGGG